MTRIDEAAFAHHPSGNAPFLTFEKQAGSEFCGGKRECSAGYGAEEVTDNPMLNLLICRAILDYRYKLWYARLTGTEQAKSEKTAAFELTHKMETQHPDEFALVIRQLKDEQQQDSKHAI